MPTSVLTVERPEDGVALVRLDRPERLNAIDAALARALRGVCMTLAADDATRVVVITGAGRGFCSGIDLRDFARETRRARSPAIERLRFQEMMASLPEAILRLPQPVIAAVNGAAVGGGLALCLAADIRICAESASSASGDPLGLSGAEMGMSYHLPRIVGTSVAADWMLTGRMVLAEEAIRCGLVSEVVPDGDLLDHAVRDGPPNRRPTHRSVCS